MKKNLTFLICLLIIVSLAVSAEASVITTGLPDGIDESLYQKMSNNRIIIEEYAPDSEVIYDLHYCGENSTNYQKLHLVLPAERENEKLPVLIVVHGGMYASGNSEEDHRVQNTDLSGLHALNRGYAVALVDYSIRNKENDTALPNQFYEIKAAVRYVRSIAEEYNLDTDRIALLGESAGGHLVNMVGSTNGEPEYDLEVYGNMDYSSDVQAVVCQYGRATMKTENDSTLTRLCNVDFSTIDKDTRRELLAKISPLNHIDGTEPPFYLEHGLADKTVSYTHSCDLYDALISVGNTQTELHLYPGMDHGVSWFQSEENCNTFLDWLDTVLDR